MKRSVLVGLSAPTLLALVLVSSCGGGSATAAISAARITTEGTLEVMVETGNCERPAATAHETQHSVVVRAEVTDISGGGACTAQAVLVWLPVDLEQPLADRAVRAEGTGDAVRVIDCRTAPEESLCLGVG